MPLIESMLSTLRSNKSIMIDKSKRFRKTKGGYGKTKGIEFNLPEATPRQLRSLKQAIRQHKQQVLKKRLLVFILILAAVFFFCF